MNAQILQRWLAVRSVPAHVIVLTAMASYGGQALAALQGWPAWAVVLATLLPWIPVFMSEMAWTYHHYKWIALLYVLTVTQLGHFGEHLIQMIQIHVLRWPMAESSGLFGALDIEWVHFIWNSWILVALVPLLMRFKHNPWLWATLVVAGWHEIEHGYIMTVYLSTGIEKTPGLLSRGGAIGGGLPVTRPDLHFAYNLIETIPIVGAFIYQLRFAYSEWLRKAFPRLTEPDLIETTNNLEHYTVAPGEVIVRQGGPADRFYIITRGEVSVSRSQNGEEKVLAKLVPGQYFGEMGLLNDSPRTATVTAVTEVELLSLDRREFTEVMDMCSATADDVARIARQRLAAPSVS